MKKWSIGKKVFAVTGSLVILVAGLGAVSVLSLRKVQANMDFAAGAMAQELELSGQIAETTQRLYLAEKTTILTTWAGQAALAAEWTGREKKAEEDLSGLTAKAKGRFHSEENQQRIGRIEAAVGAWRQTREKVLDLLSKGQPQAAQDLSVAENLPRYESMVKDADGMTAKVIQEMGEARDAGAATYAASVWTVLSVNLLAILVGLAGFWVIRNIVGTLKGTLNELRSGGSQVAAASGQIATTSQSLSQGASQQASAIEEISASMEEMSSMSKRTGENASRAAAMMGEAGALVERSHKALAQMQASMSGIKTSSEKVAKINRTIDEIAFQTNILALNAAVEAARAGDAGKGFAVVAQEVRNLAQRAAAAAKDTAALIEESIGNSGQGAQKLEQVAEAIRGITQSASEVGKLVAEVNEASQQQVQGIHQVTAAIANVSTVTQTTAASAEESAAAAQELSAQSMTVQESVARLAELAEGTVEEQVA